MRSTRSASSGTQALVSVNTDDPGFFDCDLLGENEIAGRLLDLDRAGYGRLALNSVEGTIRPATLKTELRDAIDSWGEQGDGTRV